MIKTAGGNSMILDWLYNKVLEQRDRERHKVIQLQWEKAELSRKIDLAKSGKKY